MRFRRSTAILLTAAVVAAGLIGVPPTPVSAVGETAKLPTANPANFTPNVLDGEVDSIWQVGNTVIIGGTFTQVANATINGGTVYNRSRLASFNATTGAINTGFAPVFDDDVTTVIPAADGTSIYIGGDFNTGQRHESHARSRASTWPTVRWSTRSTPAASTASFAT